MANSSPEERPRTFLIKVNPDDAPGKIGVPKDASEWEGGAFSTKHPRKTRQRIALTSEETEDPKCGDRLYIWISEKHGGSGLTASARAAGDSVPMGAGLSISVSDVELLLEARIDRAEAKQLARRGNVFDDIVKSTSRTPLRWISEADAGEIDEAVQRYSSGSAPTPSPGSGASGGQGFRRWATERLAIEKRAMDVAQRFLREQGWTVCDKSRTESYDLLCTRGNRHIFAEVKGTTAEGGQVIITYGEVEFTKANQENMLLVVVSGIELTPAANGGVSACGGNARVHCQWSPQESQLRPISYTCTL